MAVKQTRRNFFIPDDLHDQAAELAKRKGVKTADVVRTALEKYLAAVRKAEEAARAAK
jgi:hypothetical protein